MATVKYTTRDTLFRKRNFVTFGRKGAFSAGDFTLYTSSRIHIGRTTETIARKAAALFVLLWLRGVSASLADKLMDGFIIVLERQENKSLTFLRSMDRLDEQATTPHNVSSGPFMGVSIRQIAQQLGVSISEVRRRKVAGTL